MNLNFFRTLVIANPDQQDNIILENASFRQVKKAYLLKTKQSVKVILKDKSWIVPVMQPTAEEPDPVVVLEI